MKLILVLFAFIACNTASKPSDNKSVGQAVDTAAIANTFLPGGQIPATNPVIVHDTVFVPTKSTASAKQVDSLKAVIKTLNSKLFLANYKVERVRYYLKIAIKNPSQTKFLKSWIGRAIQ